MRVRLTAVIPNYNHGALVGAAIDSLTSQILAPDEIIVVDDASTDNSLDVLRTLAARDGRIKIIALEQNQGAISALNRGLSEARGDLVYFGAADDVTRSTLFSTVVPLLESHSQAAFACCEGAVIELERERISIRPPVLPAYESAYFLPQTVAHAFAKIDNWILTGAAVIRKQRLVELGGFDASLGAFADGYALRQLAFKYGCCFAPSVGLIWRVSLSGLSRQQASDPEASLKLLDAALSRMSKDSTFPNWYAECFDRRWRFGVGRIAAQAEPINKAVLVGVSARTAFDKALLGSFASIGGRLGCFLSLSWLTIRERPTSALGLLKTFWFRRTDEYNLSKLALEAKSPPSKAFEVRK